MLLNCGEANFEHSFRFRSQKMHMKQHHILSLQVSLKVPNFLQTGGESGSSKNVREVGEQQEEEISNIDFVISH